MGHISGMVVWGSAVNAHLKRIETKRTIVAGFETLLTKCPDIKILAVDASHEATIAAVKLWRPYASDFYSLKSRVSSQSYPDLDAKMKEALDALDTFIDSVYARQTNMFWSSLTKMFAQVHDWLSPTAGAARDAFDGQLEPLEVARALQFLSPLRELCSKEAQQPFLYWIDARKCLMASLRLAVPMLKQSCKDVTLTDVKIMKFFEELFKLSNQTMPAFESQSFDIKAMAAVRTLQDDMAQRISIHLSSFDDKQYTKGPAKNVLADLGKLFSSSQSKVLDEISGAFKPNEKLRHAIKPDSLTKDAKLGQDVLTWSKLLPADISIPVTMAFDVKYLALLPKICKYLADLASLTSKVNIIEDNDVLATKIEEFGSLVSTVIMVATSLVNDFGLFPEHSSAFIDTAVLHFAQGMIAIHKQSMINVQACRQAMINHSQDKHIVQICDAVASTEVLDGPDMFQRSKADPAILINKCWKKYFACLHSQSRVHQCCLDIQSRTTDMKINLDAIETSQKEFESALDDEDFMTAKIRFAILTAVQAIFRPATNELPRAELINFGRQKINELGRVSLPAKLETMMGMSEAAGY